MTIEQEAEEFALMIKTKVGTVSNLNAKEWFKAGHNSKATQVKTLQAQIDVLDELKEYSTHLIYNKIKKNLKDLQKQLKELE
jgi:hypothetical protein